METTSKPKIPPKVWIIAGAAVVLAIAVGIFAASRPKATTMHLLRTEGTVTVANDEGQAVTPKENLALYGGYGVETKQTSYAWIDLDEVKLTKMDQDSEIQIHKEDKHLEIEVKSGSLFFNVTQPLAEDETLNIRTSSMVVGIRGTCGWVVDNGEKGAQVYILEGQVEAETTDTGEAVTVSAGEMAQVIITEDGETQIEVQAFAEEYVAPFVLAELEEDTDLSAAVLSASGLDVLNPPDPAERLQAEYQEVIRNYPVLDYSVTDIYTIDDVNYGPEGLTFAYRVDLDHDGIEELLLVSGLRRTLNYGDYSYTYYTGVNKIEVYGSVYGYPHKLGEYVLISDEELAVCEQNLIDPENYSGPSLVENEERTYICIDGSVQDSYWYEYYYLENGNLLYLGEQRAIRGDYEVKPANDMSEFSDTAQYSLLIGDDLPDNLCPKIPEDIQRKNDYLNEISDDNQYDAFYFADLRDINGDGVEELITLGEVTRTFCYFSWDSADDYLRRTELETGIAYAKLIDMNQDGKEELLLVSTTDDGVFSIAVYSLDDMGGLKKEAINLESVFPQGLNIYREKTTSNIYLGGLVSEGSGGQISEFVSLTNRVYAEYEHFNPNWVYDLDNLTPAERAEVDAGLAESQRQWDEYEAQVNRFELIERINTDSFEWQESLAHTVDEVRQQLMTR